MIFELVRIGEPSTLPWFLPGVALSLVLAVVLAGRLGRVLGVRRSLAAALIVTLGIIVSATLSPLGGVIREGAVGGGMCDFSRLGIPRPGELLTLSDATLNVLLFVPLGVSIALMPPSRPRHVLLVAAVVMPFAIETTQLLVPHLGRGCESADVVDNLAGLAIGLGLGLVAKRFAPNMPGRPT